MSSKSRTPGCSGSPSRCLDASSLVARLHALHGTRTPAPEGVLRLLRGFCRTDSGIVYGRKLAARRRKGMRP